jgi:ABC-type transport system involved in multi-copper enzyme maturation permease subunit
MRWGLGPVFFYECLANSRRWQTYALRAAGVAALLFAMTSIALSNLPTTGNLQRDYAFLGQAYFYALIGVELTLVILVAPAATAGSICVDRARGTLAHMLMTDLSDSEIVLGKLRARLMPVFGLVACSWPVMAISSLLGGIDPVALVLAFATMVAVAVLGCTMALTLSVWARKSHEVILATYTLFIVVMLLYPIWSGFSSAGRISSPPEWTQLANPFYVAFAPYSVPDRLGFWDYFGFFGVTLGASALLATLAVRKTRPVACRGTVEKSKGPRIGLMGRIARWLPGPSLDHSPVLWREWHRSRPSRWMVILLTGLMGTTGVLCLTGAIALWKNGVGQGPGSDWEEAGMVSYMLHIIFGLLMLSAVAPTSMAEERQRGSLDILAATALSTRSIVVGKWLGTFRLGVLIALTPGVIALAMATARSNSSIPVAPGMPPESYREILLGARIYGVILVFATIIGHGALITSIGLALAVWIKRQSRAIAISVGLFVMILMAWPFFAFMVSMTNGLRGQGLAALSPVMACTNLLQVFAMRQGGYSGDILWWGSYWVVEVWVLALGLLWLTVRTIDACFDRISDHPWRLPVRAMVVMIVAGMMGAGSLVWAISAWAEGIGEGMYAQDLHGATAIEILGYTILLAVGLILVGTLSATSLSAWRMRRRAATLQEESHGRAPKGLAAGEAGRWSSGLDRWLEADTTINPRGLILRRWWDAFRLVLLLAIGPALLSIAWATAHEKPRMIAKNTTAASGTPAMTYVRADESANLPGAVHLGDRLVGVALLIATILVNGAAMASLGLAVATAIERPRLALTVTIGLSVLLVLGVPLYVFMSNPSYAPVFTIWGFVMVADSLLAMLSTRVTDGILTLSHWVAVWNGVFIVLSIGLLWFTIRTWQRRLLGVSQGQATPELGSEEQPPAIEAAIIGD